jgi:hypothetical protein
MIDLSIQLKDSTLSMNLISREELREKLDRRDKFKLVVAITQIGYISNYLHGLHFAAYSWYEWSK